MWSKDTIALLVKTVNNRRNKPLPLGKNDPRYGKRYGNYLAVLSVGKSLGMSVNQYRHKLERIETHMPKPRKPKVSR